ERTVRRCAGSTPRSPPYSPRFPFPSIPNPKKIADGGGRGRCCYWWRDGQRGGGRGRRCAGLGLVRPWWGSDGRPWRGGDGRPWRGGEGRPWRGGGGSSRRATGGRPWRGGGGRSRCGAGGRPRRGGKGRSRCDGLGCKCSGMATRDGSKFNIFAENQIAWQPKKARKDIKCFCYDKVIDSDLTNYKDLVESIVEQYSPRYLEVAHVQYYDPFLKIYPEVTSDQELVSMFEKLSKTKVVHLFVAYCDPSEPYEPITEWHIDVHIQPSNTEQDDDDYLRNPIPENEHVGVDEENIYLDDDDYDKLDPLIMVPCSVKERDEDYVPDHESEDESVDESEDESDEEVEEDEEVHEAEHAPHLEYDKLDPPMTEGRKYPNMAEFKLALSQHAIKHEFEFNTEKSAPHRFRAYCSRRDENKCPWRIYASTMEDGCTVMVRKNSCGHDCSSTKRKKKIKNATKWWICEHVKDWLIDDATLGPKALRKKLKEHHGINIKYKRVYMGHTW
uniref:Transposase MuDR plant domain-containing protein n=2 Tax=Aegilops tauschii subsp. strangulata TaxID=200361 RepID=A0A453FDX3_AEGTS